MHPEAKVTKQVSPFFAFFIVTVMQVGIGIFTLPRTMIVDAGHDGWIAIVFSAVLVSIIIRIIYAMLNKGDTIITIQNKVFGKTLGSFISLFWVFYYSLFVLITLVAYVEILNVWIFPEVSLWVLYLICMLLAYNYTTSGFRAIIGGSLLAVLFVLPFLFFSHLPQGQLHFGSLFPIFDHSLHEMWLSTKTMTFQFLGFEILLMAYPFIKQAPRSHKWAQIGLVFSMIIYLIAFILPVIYFHERHLLTIIWPTLTLWKMEYIGMSIWLLVLLPNMAFGLWSASRVVKQTFNLSQRHSLRGVTLVIFGCALLFTTRIEIQSLSAFTNRLGFYTIFIYIPILFLLQALIIKRRRL